MDLILLWLGTVVVSYIGVGSVIFQMLSDMKKEGYTFDQNTIREMQKNFEFEKKRKNSKLLMFIPILNIGYALSMMVKFTKTKESVYMAMSSSKMIREMSDEEKANNSTLDNIANAKKINLHLDYFENINSIYLKYKKNKLKIPLEFDKQFKVFINFETITLEDNDKNDKLILNQVRELEKDYNEYCDSIINKTSNKYIINDTTRIYFEVEEAINKKGFREIDDNGKKELLEDELKQYTIDKIRGFSSEQLDKDYNLVDLLAYVDKHLTSFEEKEEFFKNYTSYILMVASSMQQKNIWWEIYGAEKLIRKPIVDFDENKRWRNFKTSELTSPFDTTIFALYTFKNQFKSDKNIINSRDIVKIYQKQIDNK